MEKIEIMRLLATDCAAATEEALAYLKASLPETVSGPKAKLMVEDAYSKAMDKILRSKALAANSVPR